MRWRNGVDADTRFNRSRAPRVRQTEILPAPLILPLWDTPAGVAR